MRNKRTYTRVRVSHKDRFHSIGNIIAPEALGTITYDSTLPWLITVLQLLVKATIPSGRGKSIPRAETASGQQTVQARFIRSQ
jgi:hypothetical protein